MSSAEIEFTFTENDQQVAIRVKLDDPDMSATSLQIKALEASNSVLSGFEQSKNAII